MGMFNIACPQCKQVHAWFSGNPDQRCYKCKWAAAAANAPLPQPQNQLDYSRYNGEPLPGTIKGAASVLAQEATRQLLGSNIACPQCKQAHAWFSGNPDQRCYQCQWTAAVSSVWDGQRWHQIVPRRAVEGDIYPTASRLYWNRQRAKVEELERAALRCRPAYRWSL